ncbi:MAG: hypothetical protein LC799_32130 [Actinobacteria bacterium]|nr:hypothetical protein [Actinomycetota bacterium]
MITHGLTSPGTQRRAAAPTGVPTDACTVRPAGRAPALGADDPTTDEHTESELTSW